MRLDKKSKEILQELVKGKGYFKTFTVELKTMIQTSCVVVVISEDNMMYNFLLLY